MKCSASAASESELLAMPPDWAKISQLHRLRDGVSISCLNGRPASSLHLDDISRPGFGIAIVLEGNGAMALEGGSPLTMEPGTAILYSIAQPIKGWDDFHGQQTFRIVDIRFTPESLTSLCGHPPPNLARKFLRDCSVPGQNAFLGSIAAGQELTRLAADILCHQSHNISAGSHQLYLQAKSMESLALTFRHLENDQPRPGLPPPFDRPRIREAYNYIHREYCENLTVKRLSEYTGLNEKRLQAGFVALYGQSVHTCLKHTRMQAAANLLEQGSDVTTTADAVGFSSLSHFIKAFKQHWGATPTAWAKSTALRPGL
ncbi:MAG: helix-turn-helix transcriptional regulator [Marinobacter sp.]